MFDQALTNGLLAIVAAEWPGSEMNRPGFLKSAIQLMDVIVDNSRKKHGLFEFDSQVERVRPSMPDLDTEPVSIPTFRIEVDVLKEGIKRTQRIRHGRPLDTDDSNSLDDSHILALCALDKHPSLGTLAEGERDRSWFEAKAYDLWSQGCAEDYLELIGEEEADRRAEVADQFALAPGDAGASSIDECPICGREAFIAHAHDYLGNNVGIGTCLVCGYTRSDIIAEDEAISIEWEARWAHQ